MSKDRWKFLAIVTVGFGLFFASIPFFLGEDASVIALIGVIFGGCGAGGALIAFAITNRDARKN